MQTLQDEKVAVAPPRRPWLTIVVTAIAVAALGFGTWAIIEATQDDDLAVATELADAWLQAWNDADSEAIMSIFTDDGVSTDTFGNVRTAGQEAIDVGLRGQIVHNSTRIGDLTRTDEGTFTFEYEFDAYANRHYSATAEIELEGDLISRLEWLRWDLVED